MLITPWSSSRSPVQPDNTLIISRENLAACVNAAAQQAKEGLIVTLPPDLTALAHDWKDIFTRAAEAHPDGHFFYGNYVVEGASGRRMQAVRQDIGDITEREDWGPVWAVRAEWLNKIGGLDETHHRAAFYDLLLKSWGGGRRVNAGGPLATIQGMESSADADAMKSKLFFPGRGKLGGFSYLFMDPEEEQHIEAVFYNFLKRQKAWLEGERTGNPKFQTPNPKSQSDVPKVSVVTPVYNRARFISKAIESVQRQMFTDWEYVIVDNGSTDDTREVVKEYASKDPRVRLIEYNRNVIAESLNVGVKQASGKYIAQLDSDDEYLPHTLERMTSALDSNPTWGVAISYYELMDEAGNSLPEFGIVKHERYNRNNILRRDGAGALRCWHRSVIQEFGGFDTINLGHYGEDYDLVLKCGEKYEVGRVHEVCYRYRRHPDNTDVLRDPEMKIQNKTKARLAALARRKQMNESR
jgi:teichuronic acid biosynthesis glycosyltransferase TuaG